MDGQEPQDGDGQQKTKPHGNLPPKRGAIMKQIIKDLTGGGGGGKDNDSSNGGGGEAAVGGSATAAGNYGAD
nr:unnamed protein product [Digitaria exilis]